MSYQIKLEITVIMAIALVVFVAAVFLPTKYLFEFVTQNPQLELDGGIFVLMTLSPVLLIFFVRRWRELQSEVKTRNLISEQLQQTIRTTMQLTQMTTLLQSCFTSEEAYELITHYARQLFPDDSGAVYMFRSSRNLLETAAEWGEETGNERIFSPHQCWALRQGHIYDVQDPTTSIICPHVKHADPYVCMPMIAHGEVLALLHMQRHAGAQPPVNIAQGQESLLRAFGEQVALSLSNLSLRDSLRQQSIRDPLTGLFNRRYLEEALTIEAERAKRSQASFSIIMLDLDHFKRFNDSHGHDAGDAVLQTLGKFLQRHVRGGDIACRYGGEEFTIVLSSASLKSAHQRAEQLCEGVRALTVEYKNGLLSPMTISVGVAAFPDHGENWELVLHAADVALYQAKNDGRDRVTVAV